MQEVFDQVVAGLEPELSTQGSDVAIHHGAEVAVEVDAAALGAQAVVAQALLHAVAGEEVFQLPACQLKDGALSVPLIASVPPVCEKVPGPVNAAPSAMV